MKKLLPALAVFMFTAEANASLIVDIDGADYRIYTITGIYSSQIATLRDQVWWGDSDLAAKFSYAVGTQLGTLNISGYYAPAFAYSEYTGAGVDYVTVRAFAPSQNKSLQVNAGGTTWTFATANFVPNTSVPVPAPIWLFGISFLGLLGLKIRHEKSKARAGSNRVRRTPRSLKLPTK